MTRWEDTPNRHAYCDAGIARLRKRVAEYEHAIGWHTSCTSCATVLDSSIAEHERAERAAAKLAAITAHFRQKAEEFNATMPMTVRPEDMRVSAGDILAIIKREQGDTP